LDHRRDLLDRRRARSNLRKVSLVIRGR
jgi:hypothetical protein